jgi:hypothetical protein
MADSTMRSMPCHTIPYHTLTLRSFQLGLVLDRWTIGALLGGRGRWTRTDNAPGANGSSKILCSKSASKQEGPE